MSLTVSIRISVLPSLALMTIVVTRTRHRRVTIAVFIAAYLTAIPVLLLENAVRVDNPAVRAFGVVGLFEESAKFALILTARRLVSMGPEGLDAVGATSGIGLATFENILHDRIGTSLLRGVTALPLHLATALYMARDDSSDPGGGGPSPPSWPR